jgi:hypothetical protein
MGAIVVTVVVLLLAAGISNWRVGGTGKEQPLQFYDAKLATEFLVPDKRGARDVRSSDRLVEVSMVQLIANPENWHNQAVRLSGFMHVHFEGTGIYLSREHANYLNSRNGLWVSFDSGDWSAHGMIPQQFDRKHVLIEGIFDRDDHGHMGAWAGAVRSVWRVMEEWKYYDN